MTIHPTFSISLQYILQSILGSSVCACQWLSLLEKTDNYSLFLSHPLLLYILSLRGVRWLSGEGIGLVIRRLLDRFPAVQNDVVSLGKALHPTCSGGNVPVFTVSRSG